MDIPQIIFEEGIIFEDETKYNNFITFCEWYIYDEDPMTIKDIPREDCIIFKDLCFHYVEPNFALRITKKYHGIELDE